MNMENFVALCLCVFMYRVAIFEKMNGWVWVFITFICILTVSYLISAAYLNSFIGLFISYGLMTAWKIHKGEYKKS